MEENKILINRTRVDKDLWGDFKSISQVLFPKEGKPHEILLDKMLRNTVTIYRKKLL